MSQQKDEKKRARAPNFSPDEKVALLNLIKKYSHIIENKKTDAVTWQDKSKAWREITNTFNSTSRVHRTTESIKGFYENQKRLTHKKAAIEKREIKLTGGGSYKTISDPLFDLTMDIINRKTVYGLPNNFDGNQSLIVDVHNEVGNKWNVFFFDNFFLEYYTGR
jgi:hypothetical protein